MNCDESRQLARLDAGQDLRPEEKQQLASHLAQCPSCADYLRDMERMMSVLAAARSSEHGATDQRESCWNRLSVVIRDRRLSQRAARQFNGSVIALCVCSLLLALGTIVQHLPTAGVPASNRRMPAHAVGNSSALGSHRFRGADRDSLSQRYLIRPVHIDSPVWRPLGTPQDNLDAF